MSTRSKILWISHFLPYPPKGGAQIRSFNLIKELSKQHDVYLFCVADKNKLRAYFHDVDDGVREAKTILTGVCKSIEIHWLPHRGSFRKQLTLLRSLLSRNSYSVSLLDDVDVNKLVNFSRTSHFDWIHLDTVALTRFIRFLPSASISLNHHNIESDMMVRRAEKESSFFKSWVYKLDGLKIKRMEKGSARHLRKHIVCSELDKQRLQDILPHADISIVENGIDVPDEGYISGTTARRGALFIGGLDWYPNADAVKFLLREIWPILKKKEENTSLDIVGKNPTAELTNLARQYEGVTIHGFVDNIQPFYESKKFFICPIRDGGGTKLKILDAMARRIPILAHPIAFEGLDAVPDVHYFSASSAEEFAEKIVLIESLADEKLNEMARKAFLLVKAKYDYLSIGKKLAELYNKR